MSVPGGPATERKPLKETTMIALKTARAYARYVVSSLASVAFGIYVN